MSEMVRNSKDGKDPLIVAIASNPEDVLVLTSGIDPRRVNREDLLGSDAAAELKSGK